MMYGDTCEWTMQSVQNCLDDYSELFAVCQTPSVGSSWSQGKTLRTRAGSCGYMTPGMDTVSPHLNLLATKWALEEALSDLSQHARRIFRLRYSARMTQKEIGECLGCSRQQVFYELQKISQALLKTLSSL